MRRSSRAGITLGFIPPATVIAPPAGASNGSDAGTGGATTTTGFLPISTAGLSLSSSVDITLGSDANFAWLTGTAANNVDFTGHALNGGAGGVDLLTSDTILGGAINSTGAARLGGRTLTVGTVNVDALKATLGTASTIGTLTTVHDATVSSGLILSIGTGTVGGKLTAGTTSFQRHIAAVARHRRQCGGRDPVVERRAVARRGVGQRRVRRDRGRRDHRHQRGRVRHGHADRRVAGAGVAERRRRHDRDDGRDDDRRARHDGSGHAARFGDFADHRYGRRPADRDQHDGRPVARHRDRGIVCCSPARAIWASRR